MRQAHSQRGRILYAEPTMVPAAQPSRHQHRGLALQHACWESHTSARRRRAAARWPRRRSALQPHRRHLPLSAHRARGPVRRPSHMRPAQSGARGGVARDGGVASLPT